MKDYPRGRISINAEEREGVHLISVNFINDSGAKESAIGSVFLPEDMPLEIAREAVQRFWETDRSIAPDKLKPVIDKAYKKLHDSK